MELLRTPQQIEEFRIASEIARQKLEQEQLQNKPTRSNILFDNRISAPSAGIQDISGKVDKESGKSLISDSAITDLTDGGETTLHTHPGGGGGVTLVEVKADTDIASAISLKHALQDLSGLVSKVAGSSLVVDTEITKIHASGSDNQDISGKVDKVTNKSLVLDTEISKIHSVGSDNQDLSVLQPKETGKGLSANDLTAGLKTSYDEAVTHAGSTHAPTDAQKNSNITKAEIEAKLTGEISTHAHAGGGGLALGELSTNAYYGDKGKTAYDHSQVAHAPSGATVGADWNTNVTNKPTIPAAQVQTDWNASSGIGQLLNKPTISVARLLANLATPVITSGTTEKVLLQLAIPVNNAVVGSTYRAWIIGNSSSTGTLIFKVRCGAGGIITDTITWTAVTSAAQVANARAGFDALITIRSGTTIKVEGIGYAGTVQLPTTIAAPATQTIAISGIWYISLTVICSSGTFTAQVGNIEEIR